MTTKHVVPTEGTSPVDRLAGVARWSHAHRGVVVVGWVLVLLVSAAAYLVIGAQSQSPADGFVGDSGRAERLETSGDFLSSRTETVLVRSDDATTTAAAAQRLRSAVAGVPGVEQVVDTADAVGGTQALVRVRLDDAEASPSDRVTGLTDAITATRAAIPGATVEATGPVSVQADVTQTYAERLALLEYASLPVTAVVLLIVFAGVTAAVIPLVVGLAVVLFAVAWSGPTSFLVPAHENQISLILLIGLALGVDYSLFYVRRMREEYGRHGDVDAAARVAVAATSRSVVVAGVTTGVSVIATFLTESPIFHSLTLGLVLAVVAAVAASLTLLPALLGYTGRGVVGRRLRRRVEAGDHAERDGLWGRLTATVVRNPVPAVVAGAVVMLLLAAPVLGLRLGLPGTDTMSRSYASLATLDDVAQEFPYYGVSHTVVVPTDGDPQAATAALRRVADTAATAPGFADRERAVEVSADGTVARVEIPVATDAVESDRAKDTVRALREQIIPASGLGGRALVGGETAVSMDLSASVGRDLLVVIAAVLALSFLLVLAAFRSLALAAVSVVLNLLSVLASYGVVVAVFQFGWGSAVFGDDYTNPIVTLLPILMFVMLFGLSTDYHVFILTRVRDAVVTSPSDVSGAIRRGVVASSVPVTAAAAVMVVVFALFTILPTAEMKQIGVGLAVAVALDATVVRGVLLPAALALLGGRVWGRRLPTATAGEVDGSTTRTTAPSAS